MFSYLIMAMIQNQIPKSAREAEKQYLSSLTEIVNVDIYDVPIGSQQYIHTLKASPNTTINKPNFLLLHGFTGALGHWKPLIPHLTDKNYKVYAIDILGWGLSSRPNIFPNWEWFSKSRKSVNDVRHFWVDSIENWRKTENISNLHVVGHSLGGWIAGEYALKYPQHIHKLTLANSVGVYPKDPSWFNGHAGIFMESTRTIFGINWPFRLMRFIDRIFPTIIGNNTLSNYIREYSQLHPSGEIASEYIRRTKTDNTLWNRLTKINFPVNLIYSQNDHMVPTYNSDILSQFKKSTQVDITILGMNSGHSPTEPEIIYTVSQILLDQKKKHLIHYPHTINYTYTKSI